MTRIGTLAMALAVAGAALLGQQPAARASDRVRLETAINKEVVDGDLPGAAEIYRTLVQSADRTVRAQALLRLGRVYLRTNHADATRTLEQVLAFTDQPDVVAAAREALDRTGQSRPAMSAPRTVLVNSRQMNAAFPAVSGDGRYLAYSDYNANANLVIRDSTTGLARQITTDAVAPGTEIAEKAFSRDGRRIAFTFDVQQIRVVDVGVAAAQTPAARTVFTVDTGSVAPFDWSADGSRLALQALRQGTAQIGVLTIADGSFDVVRSIDWRGSSRLALSPDGAYLAYDRAGVESGERDVYVVSTNGTQETAISVHDGRDVVVGWSADGRHLLFLSERDGANCLYAQPMRAGRPSGTAALLRANVAPTPVGITRQGDVYFKVNPSTVGIYVAPFDARGRLGAAAPKRIDGMRPVWSPDGTEIAHAVARSRAVLGITTIATGRTREIVLNDLNYMQEFAWGPDGRSIVAKGASHQGRAGLFRIEVRTGAVTTIALQEPEAAGPTLWNHPIWWRGVDSIAHIRLRTNQIGRLPGIRQPGPDAPRLLERDLTSGAVRELVDFSSEPWATNGVTASPDRRVVASRSPGPGDGGGGPGAYRDDPTSYVVLHDVATGRSRRLWTAPFPQAFTGPIEWLPDGSAVLVTKRTEAGGARYETWIVPVDGSAPRRVEGGAQNLADGVRLSPDGRRVAMLAGDRRDEEIQVFERIVPGSRAR